MRVPSIAQIRGIISGAIILTLFGGFWCLAALINWAAHPSWSIPAGVAATLALLTLCVARLFATRKIPSVHDPSAAAAGKRTGKIFGIIFGIEGGAIVITSVLLARNGLALWIPIAIAVIVGVHFFPLAQVFKVPLYHLTGALCLAAALGSLLVHDPVMRAVCVGFAMAAALWLSVLLLLLQTRLFR